VKESLGAARSIRKSHTARLARTASEPSRFNVGLLASLIACLDFWSVIALGVTKLL
jgi:hypothetical protein